jgi:hypothetical protein
MSTSSAAGAHSLVAAFRAGATAAAPAPAAWRLDRAAVADRLDELIDQPTRVRQGRLNLCGPAAVLSLWFGRDPVGTVEYAISLFTAGQASIGDLRVVPSPRLRQLPYGSVEQDRACPQADWMMMAALRDSANRLVRYRRARGPWEAAAAITMPSAMRRWLTATGAFASVRDETNLMLRKGMRHATALRPTPSRELLLLVAQEMFRRPAAWHRRARDRVISLVPNHWLVLRSPIETAANDAVRFVFWSWGGVHEVVLPRPVFDRCYYGCLRALPVPPTR